MNQNTAATRHGPLDRTHWYGWLCIDNYMDIATRLSRMLDGKAYTFVATREGCFRPTDVRTSNRLIQPIKVSLTDGLANITCVDARYVWGLHASAQSEADARDGDSKFNHMFITFGNDYRGESMEVEQFNGLGERLHWTVMVEDSAVSE